MRMHDLGGFSSLDMKWILEKQEEEEEKAKESSERELW